MKRVTPHPKVVHVVAHDAGSRVTADLEWNGIHVHVCVTFDLVVAQCCLCCLCSKHRYACSDQEWNGIRMYV